MPAVELVRNFQDLALRQDNPLPDLMHTPAGLAILEIQGAIHAPLLSTSEGSTEVGRLEFPLYEANEQAVGEGPWMKKVFLYIGKHQRLTGEVKKLPKPMVVISKPNGETSSVKDTRNGSSDMSERLDMLAVIKYKILFSSRPEPVGL